jgi:hypothetical protein
MIRRAGLAALIGLGACVPVLAAAQDQERALAVEREVERIAGERVLWPGYDPLAIPLAVYTGERTYLFRHPKPPEGFSPVAGSQPAAFAFQGRHPAVTSNTSAEIGGIVTATLLVDRPSAGKGATDFAAVALHEAFHVYQRRHHPTWSGNEGDLFLYPVDDARLLGLRRLESAALRRALGAPDSAGVACWARLALGYRRERFAAMDTAFWMYERKTELNEGLAAYIQLRAAGKTTVEIPVTEFPPAQVRDRTYVIGPALAFLLDRRRPGWQAALEASDKQYLDRMLESALGPGGQAPRCALAADEIEQIEWSAKQDVAAVIAARGERRKAFDARPGWRVIVEAAPGKPLWPQGFGNDAGDLQAIDEAGADLEALTEGIGPHPIFNGVRRITIAGLAEPETTTEGRKVTVRAPGFTAQFKNAGVQVSGTETRIRIESPK